MFLKKIRVISTHLHLFMKPFNATQNKKMQKYYYEILSTTLIVNLLQWKIVKRKEEKKLCQSKLFYCDCFIFQKEKRR